MFITLATIDKVFKAKQASVESMELRGYELIEELFVDSSGFGQEGELALTKSQFVKRLTELLGQHSKLMAKITGAGQFQVYVGLFKKAGKSKSKKLENNTYRIEGDNGDYSIRLYNTNIIEFRGNKVILNTGGFNTNTTIARFNKYLPNGWRVYRKNYEVFLDKDGEVMKFFGDSLTIELV